MNCRLLALPLLASLLALPALADKPNREIVKDKIERADDRADRLQARVLLDRFSSARKRNDVVALQGLDDDVMRFLRQEGAEGVVELAGDRKEVRQSRREVARADGPVERAAEKRDLRDDRRDKKAERVELTKTAQIAQKYGALSGKVDKASLNQKHALLKQMLHLENKEVRRDNAEVREDKRERREDRRENRREKRK